MEENNVIEDNQEKVTLTDQDEKMLKLIDLLITVGMISTKKEFADTVGMHKQGISLIMNGKQSFTVNHINTVCKKFNVNANWIFGTEPNVFRKV